MAALFDPHFDAAKQLAERTRDVEEMVRSVARRHLAVPLGEQGAIVAVGGFGRGDLFRHSDVDLLLLVDRTETAVAIKESISLFLRDLWDDGLQPSHSVHTVEECCQFDTANVELTVSLLTRRFLAGGTEIYARLEEAMPVFLRTQRRAVTQHLLRLTAERRSKFSGTIYHLEPDVKEAPGGLRDIHLIEWLGALRGAPFAESIAAIEEPRRFLSQVRSCLHTRAKRNDNRLLFDAQDDLFANPAESMREYYRHARAVDRETRQVIAAVEEPSGGMLRSFLDWRSRLSTTEFSVSREQVFLRNPHLLEADPKLLFRLLQFSARHGFKMSADTERRMADLARSRDIPASGLWRELRDLLNLPHAALAIRAMHDTGLLKAWLPEWSRIECLVTRDFYHRYTVDEHTLVTLETIDGLAASKDDARRQFRELLSETPDVHLLRLALLLHDIGKGGGTGEHETESTRITAEVLDRLGASAPERDMVLYLVRHHIDLSALMTARDLHDPEVVAAAAHQIGTLERLQLLTLLTYADISAVFPGALTPWRMAQLWSAYRNIHQELTRELDAERIAAAGASDADTSHFLDGLPTRYTILHPPAEVARHAAMARTADSTGVAIELEHHADAWELTVVTKDRPALFADLSGTLAGFGMNILKAEAFGNHHGVVLDILRFADTSRRLELNPDEALELRRLIERVVVGRESAQRRLAGRPRPTLPSRKARITPVVGIDAEASARATLVEVIAEDRPGLLHDIARVIANEGLSIDVVLVNTEAHKAIDVFYLTANGGKLSAGQQASLRNKLLATLAPPKA